MNSIHFSHKQTGIVSIMIGIVNRKKWGLLINGKREFASISLLLLLGFFLSACSGGATQVFIPPTATDVVQVDQEPTEEIVVDQATDTPVVEDTPELKILATEEPRIPTRKTALVATDPESVNLASGKPTLVEFFAFW
jgi:hypothetical protein